MCMTSTSPTATTPPIAAPVPSPLPPSTPPTAACMQPDLQSMLRALEQSIGALQGVVASLGGGLLPPAPPLPDANGPGGGVGGHGGHGAHAAPVASSVGAVDPSTVRDKASTGGLSAAARRGLEEAHRFGLPLVSGKRSGGGGSDHDHGNAIDVGTLPIGSPSSSRGTPQMQAFAEHMRQQGKAGNLDVKYVIHNGMIASPRDGWQWRPYTYPGKTAAELESLRRSNPGEFNRLQHYDHVHVSFG